MSNRRQSANFTNTAIGLGVNPTADVYGAANAEFLKGLRGVDYQSGVEFDRSLLDIEQYKVNPDNVKQNLKQQAGYSAEIAGTSRKNAESIIQGKGARYSRSEDVATYGKNHKIVDIVELLDGDVISEAQMKFVGDKNLRSLLNKIADGSNKTGKNDLSRYMQIDELQLPSDQVDKAKSICVEQAEKLRKQAERLRAEGNGALANQKELSADNFDKLKEKISDSGLTAEEAMVYRTDPTKMTVKDIAKTSHKAGIEGAKFGAAIGGSISLIINLIALSSGEKELADAAIDCVIDTGVSAGVGYVSAFSGSAIKGLMQQSSSESARALSTTALPALVVSVCIACGSSIYSYTQGNISEVELFKSLGGNASGMLSSTMFSAIGQIAIPIPVLGGLVGGMVGYTLSNMFYQGFFASLDEAKRSREELDLLRKKCAVARDIAQEYQRSLDEIFTKKLTQLSEAKEQLFSAMNQEHIDVDEFCAEVNRFAKLLGKQLKFNNQSDFNKFMSSNDTLEL